MRTTCNKNSNNHPRIQWKLLTCTVTSITPLLLSYDQRKNGMSFFVISWPWNHGTQNAYINNAINICYHSTTASASLSCFMEFDPFSSSMALTSTDPSLWFAFKPGFSFLILFFLPLPPLAAHSNFSLT